MDQEIAPLKLSTNQLVDITGVHRRTAAARLKNVGPTAGSNSELKLYLVIGILSELMIPTVSTSSIEEIEPSDRLAHWKAKSERLRLKVDTKQLIPAEDVAREFSLMMKTVVTVLETLPDILERDCTLTPAVVSCVQDVIDGLRDQVVQEVMDAEREEEEPEED